MDYFNNPQVTSNIGINEKMLGTAKILRIILAILRSPAKPIRKDLWSCRNSYRLFWKSYGYHHNRYENQPRTFEVLMVYIGNLQVTSKIGTTKALIEYFGNLMVGGTTDMKISLKQTASSMYRI